TRGDALALLHEWNANSSLRKHALLVEAGVRGYAADDGLDDAAVERWGIAGLLHALDYERFPDAASHGATGGGGPRATRLDNLVYGCDERAGFLVAVALMRPSRLLADVEPATVRKRMRDRAFARARPPAVVLSRCGA